MASLSSGLRLGGGSASSLIRSANSLSAQIAAYNDSLEAFKYSNSAYTDSAFSAYKDYLRTRINALQASGGISNIQKALTLTKTLDSAGKSNVSASIARENISILTGGATKQDKLTLIGQQFQRATANGDMTLAQQLESQYYNLSQQIQYEAQQSAAAQSALNSAKVSYQEDVVSNLKNALQSFTQLAQNTSESQVNSSLKKFVQDNAHVFQALGVNIKTQQPNYWDVVNGIAGAIYNHAVLKAQAEAPIDPLKSANYAQEAQQYLNGQTTFDTLGGSLTMTELQQAMRDPSMFSFDNSTGKYVKNTQSGYQYLNINGKQTLVPTYSGIAPRTQQGGDNVLFLTPNETSMMSSLGLNFDKNANQTTGNGVRVQVTQNSPDWLKNVLGENGVANFYTDNNGHVIFKAASLNGKGDVNNNAFYTLGRDLNGKAGLFEHTANGTTQFLGGDNGFNAGAVQLLINSGSTVQRQIQIEQQQLITQAKLAVQKLQTQASVPLVKAPTQAPLIQPSIKAPTIQPAVAASRIQNTAPAQSVQPAASQIQGVGGGAVPGVTYQGL